MEEQPQYSIRHHFYSLNHSMNMSPSQPSPSPSPENDRRNVELECNLSSLCDHIQSEGFGNGTFSDIVVHAMGSTYHLHRLILSRSSYFRNMLHGPWKEASAPVVALQIDDNNVNAEAIAIALAYLYGHHPKLNDDNAFRVLAAASFLDLQDLCAICTDFIIAELWTSNFLAYQVFVENQDYGIHGEKVRNACWGYLCQSGFMELKEVLPKLSSQTLHVLLSSNELWVPSEEKRFELALYTLLKKSALSMAETQEIQSVGLKPGVTSCHSSSELKGKNVIDTCYSRDIESDSGHISSKGDLNSCNAADSILVELTDKVFDTKQQVHQGSCSQPSVGARYSNNLQRPSLHFNSFFDSNRSRPSSDGASVEGPSEENICYQFSNSSCLTENVYKPGEWGRNDLPLSWGGRVVARRPLKCYDKGNCGLRGEEHETFISVFEEGSLLYCNMSLEALVNVRKQLEELGFPGKAVNDGLWLQMLLSWRVQEIAAATCKNCCLLGMPCACRFANTGYYMQASDQHNPAGNTGNLYVGDSDQGEGNDAFRPVRVHVRGSNEGLAGIGRGATSVPASAWPPTRFVFSRVPFGMGNTNGQQSLANDDLEVRPDQHVELPGDGLTAVVGLSDRGRNIMNGNRGQVDRGYEVDLSNSFIGTCASGPSSIGVQMLESPDQDFGIQWEDADNASISLDMKTPLSHFPPFRFGVEFQDVHRLSDGQVKHSHDAFYAGSFWKISVQAFNDEDPQGRRTLGLFIHRRKAEATDPLRKAHMYVDSREKVTARYQLICPSKREVMVFGSAKQAGALLPKAPKGWGWRSAFLFDELPDLLQNGCLRLSAVVQLV